MKKGMETTPREAPPTQQEKANATNGYTTQEAQEGTEEQRHVQGKEDYLFANQGKGADLRNVGGTGTTDQRGTIGRKILGLGGAEEAEGVIGPLTPIHMADLGPVMIKNRQSVWGALPRPKGPPAANADNGLDIISVNVININVSSARCAFIYRARLQNRVNNFYNAYDSQEVFRTALENMMTWMGMVMK